MTASALAVHGVRPKVIRPSDVYFAFGSGRLAYDCVACQAKCCRGFGYELETPVQLLRQLCKRPALGLFISPRGPSAATSGGVMNLPPSCFFLDSDNRCQVHNEFGYDAKPETCRLFPFNAIFSVGDHLLVRGHDFLCPLTVLPDGQKSDASQHELLVANMQSQGIRQPPKELVPAIGSAPAAIALERAVVVLSEAHIGDDEYMPFAVAQTVLAGAVGDDRRNRVDEAWATDELGRFRAMLLSVLGIDENDPCLRDPMAARVVIGTTAHWRSRIAFRSAEQRSLELIDMGRAPKLLIALHAMVALARKAGMNSVTFQTVSRLYHEHARLLYVLAHVDCTMQWRPNAWIPLAFDGTDGERSAYVTVVRTLLRAPLPGGPKLPLGVLLVDNLHSSEANRLTFLRNMASRLGGSICPLGAGSRPRYRKNWRGAVRRVLLPRLNHQLLTMVSVREARAGARDRDTDSVHGTLRPANDAGE